MVPAQINVLTFYKNFLSRKRSIFIYLFPKLSWDTLTIQAFSDKKCKDYLSVNLCNMSSST
jgi:hypothetical protein